MHKNTFTYLHKNIFTYLHKNFLPNLHSRNFTVKSFKSQKASKKNILKLYKS